MDKAERKVASEFDRKDEMNQPSFLVRAIIDVPCIHPGIELNSTNLGQIFGNLFIAEYDT